MNIASKLRKIDKESTVFSISDIQTILGIQDKKSLYNSLFYASEKGDLYQISEGIYGFNAEYSRKEFANKFRRPSYISTYTVLQGAGVVFQPYESIYAISNRSENAEIDGQSYVYRKVKDEILLNSLGTKIVESVHTATIERAICDKIYLDGMEHFDNLRDIDWDLMKEINEKVYSEEKNIKQFIQENLDASITDK